MIMGLLETLGDGMKKDSGGEGGIRTHERASAPYAISSRACSATPAPLRDPWPELRILIRR